MNKNPMEEMEFTPLEERLMLRSGDSSLAGRQKQAAVIVAILFLALFIVAAIVVKNNIAVAMIGVIYVILTLVEKLCYIKAISAYRALVVKLGKTLNGKK